MSGTEKAGAVAVPADSINVHGIEFTVDSAYIESWAFMERLRKLNDKGADAFEKLDVSFEIIEGATGIDKERIIEAAGGETAPAADVMQIVAEFVKAMTPKN